MTRQSGEPSADVKNVGADGALDTDLAQMYEKLNELQTHAASLGLFANDRELLVCPSCGLQEDVTIEGMLITHDFESPDASDSGLRFTERQDGHFSCPRCSAKIGGANVRFQLPRIARQFDNRGSYPGFPDNSAQTRSTSPECYPI